MVVRRAEVSRKMDDGMNSKIVAEEHEHWQPLLQRVQNLIAPPFDAANRLQHFKPSDLFGVGKCMIGSS